MLKLFVFASCFLSVSQGDAYAQRGGQLFRPVSSYVHPFENGQEMIAPDWVNNRLILLEKQLIPIPLVSSKMDVKVDDRLIWRNLLNNSYRNRRIISTIYKTSTTTVPVTFTCALTFVPCASISRNRLSIPNNDESEQFEAISSSQVVTIEPTVVSEESVRETRQSNPQLYYQQPYNNEAAGPIGVSYPLQLIDGYLPFFGSDSGINSRQIFSSPPTRPPSYGLYGGGSSGSYCLGFGSGGCSYGSNNAGITGYSNNEGYGVSPGVSALSESIGSHLDHVLWRPFNGHNKVHFTSVTPFSVLVTTQTKTLSRACDIDSSSMPLCPKMG